MTLDLERVVKQTTSVKMTFKMVFIENAGLQKKTLF
jgi:hypothetical protein